MKLVDIVAPELGEGVTHATIGQWNAKVGGAVSAGETVVELATDKAAFDVPAPASGVLHECIAKPDEEVVVGTVIGRIAIGDER